MVLTERLEVIERALPHFKAILSCKDFIATGSYALYKMGLVDEVNDLDIILVEPSVDALDILHNLQMLPESKHLIINHESDYPVELIRIMYEGVKVDFFTNDRFSGRLVLYNDKGIKLSAANNIFAAKRNANRFKDWLSLRAIADKIFNDTLFKAFLDGAHKKGQ